MTTTNGLASRPIIGKFSLSKEEIPLMDVLSVKTHQEVFQTSVNNFSLTICLRMVYRAELEDSSKLSPKCTPKMTNKLGITIGSDHFGNAMKLDYLLEIQLNSMRCIKSFVARDKMGHFLESLFLWVLGKPTTKSRLISSHRAFGTGNGIYSLVFYL
jgi:hypothetical protein